MFLDPPRDALLKTFLQHIGLHSSVPLVEWLLVEISIFLELCRWKSLSETHNLRNCFNKSPNNSLQVNRVTMLPRRQGNLTIRLAGPPGNVETPSAWTWFIWIPIINGANTHFKLVAVLNPELLVARWNTTKFLGEVIAAWH